MKCYFAKYSESGSEISPGFANDTRVAVFDSRHARDDFVRTSDNISCNAITARQATAAASNVSLVRNELIRPKPFSGEFWAITEPEHGEPEAPGLIGYLRCVTDDDYGIVARFY